MNILRSAIVLPAIVCAFALSAGAVEAPSAPSVKWEILPAGDDNATMCVQRFTVNNVKPGHKLCFNQLPRPMHTRETCDTLTEINAGYYYLTSPKFAGEDSEAVIDVVADWQIRAISEIPESFHVVDPSGKITPVTNTYLPILDASLSNPGWRQWTVTADSLFRLNERLRQGRQPGPFDIVPSLKKVTSAPGTFRRGLPVRTALLSHPNPEYYRITLTPDSALIEGATPEAMTMARRTLDHRLLDPNGGSLPCAVIEDWPDFPFRGIMIDIARNFQTPETMKHLMDVLADYKINRLHFHITDDEGWRLEIPGLPELTAVGARRGYTSDSSSFLPQIFSGDGNPDSSKGTANGFFTRNEFIDFLKHCHSLGIAVVPEIESPGHARAAIKAMENRFRTTGDDTYLLILPCDTSRYTTAQFYHDNLMNPAAPGTYRFMDKVIDEISAMYRDAGVPLPGIHLGGDEVPEGAWDGSPQACALADSLGVEGRHGLQGEFVRRIARMMKDKGIPMYGWQDIYTGYDASHHAAVAPAVGGVDCWVSSLDPDKNVAVKGLQGGYPVILSNVDYFYLDMLPAPHPQERGLYWGGFVDELRTLAGYADTICPPQPGAPGRIIGLCGKLFAETIRNPQMMHRLVFPKVAGIAERAWNRSETYTDADFNILIGRKELPRLVARGITPRLRQPGITVENGMIFMNSPYPDAEIRFTLDGSIPEADSQVYTGPMGLPAGTTRIRAILLKDGLTSVETVSVL